jgi:hypothetical protein
MKKILFSVRKRMIPGRNGDIPRVLLQGEKRYGNLKKSLSVAGHKIASLGSK